MQPTLKPKMFTVDEVNKLIPALERAFNEITELSDMIKALSADLRELANIWGDSIFSEKNPDNSYYKNILARRDTTSEALNQKMSSVNAMGCMIKDINKGIVDFYHDFSGRTIMLCWRRGEKKVEHWHDIGNGFFEREKLENLTG